LALNVIDPLSVRSECHYDTRAEWAIGVIEEKKERTSSLLKVAQYVIYSAHPLRFFYTGCGVGEQKVVKEKKQGGLLWSIM